MQRQSPRPLAALRKLFESLNAGGIRYCHWKSNRNLDRSFRGLADFDLLIDPAHQERFRLVLQQQDVKAVVSPPPQQCPGIEDYLGFDAETGQLFHLHVHYQLILGEHFVKNLCLPAEEAFFKDVALYDELVPVPRPEVELAVLVVRMLLKYRDRDFIKDTFSIRSNGIASEMLEEVEYLVAQTSSFQIRETLSAELAFISPEIVLEFVETVRSSPRAAGIFWRLRRRLLRELAPYQRYSPFEAKGRYMAALLRRRFSRLVGYSSKKTPICGGRTIALVGADGSGKSTVIEELNRWLAWKLRVKRYYMGSQERSWLSTVLHTGFRLARKAWYASRDRAGDQSLLSQLLDFWQRLMRQGYALSVGRDRYRRFAEGRHQANHGTLVIYDRYPLKALHAVMEGRPMDGPQIAAEAGYRMDRVTRMLASLEERLYQKILPPDRVFLLHVSPDMSQRRKPDHDRQMIENKSRALVQMNTQDLPVSNIDADQPLDQVILQLKAAIWREL